jgi:stress response protein YsnF
MLREELHIRKRQNETRKPQQITLRKEEVTIERVGGHEQLGG